jgi:hypothetical protein
MFDTQLSDFNNFDIGSVIFYKPEPIHFSDENNTFKKVKICVKNKDGSIGDLVFSAPNDLFSFGVQEIKNSEGMPISYILPICLWKKKDPTVEEQSFIEVLEKIINLCKDQVEKYTNSPIELKRFSPLSFKSEEEKSPILYTKLIFNKKQNKISSLFIDEYTNKEINPLSVLNKKCYITAAIKIESIFISDKITLQIKLYEAIVKVLKHSKRLLVNNKSI